AGFLPVPYLWGELDEFKYAKSWKTKPIKGSVKIVDENNKIVKAEKVVNYARNNLKEVEYILNQKMKIN
ncbi:hypothetical protein, partial [Tepidimicrobium xylanilyticum]